MHHTQPLSVIILAAGQGTRMKSHFPKVMHKLAHKPMIKHVVETAVELEPEKIITVTGPNMEMVQDTIAKSIPLDMEAHIVIQQERLGTAHAVKTALPYLEGFKGNVMILYGDTPLITVETLKDMIEHLESNRITGAVVLGFRPDDPAEYGRLETNDAGELLGIVEYKDATEEQRDNDLCNSGVMIINGDKLAHLLETVDNKNAKGEFYLTDIIGIARKKGLVSTYAEVEDETEVLGVNDRIQLAEAEYHLQTRLRAEAMINGATLIDPDSIYFSTDTVLGKDVTIHPHVVFGPGVKVHDFVEIRSFSHIEGATVARGAVIGPFARLRPGADIGEKAHIGNFVEIKKAKIEKNAKINHLSYIGDARVGDSSNIGAGTITCNYDGFTKSFTDIGKDCFIGSHSTFIAPITIGDGVITAAGSVITKNVEADALAIARPEQQNLKAKGKEIRARKHSQQA